MFSNDVYDKLKWAAQIMLPALGTLWFTISSIWGIPFGNEVLGTITAIDLFLGGLLGLSKRSYEGDGTMIVDTSNPERDIYRMELSDPLDHLTSKDYVTFKVVNNEIGD